MLEVAIHSDFRPAFNFYLQFNFIANFMFAVDFEHSEFHSPIVSRCGDVLSFVFSPLFLFLHAGAVVTGLICEFSEGAVDLLILLFLVCLLPLRLSDVIYLLIS
jgi:hypothetical protein